MLAVCLVLLTVCTSADPTGMQSTSKSLSFVPPSVKSAGPASSVRNASVSELGKHIITTLALCWDHSLQSI